MSEADRQQIKEAIAFAIEVADTAPVPDGYADKNGYPDAKWLSDWGAFLAERVLYELNEHGFVVTRSPEINAGTC